MLVKALSFAFCFASLGMNGAEAQTDAPSAPKESPHPCAPASGTSDQSDLSDKLADCSGVLIPPGSIDQGIKAQAPDPDPGTTPVIRPPTGEAEPK